MTPYKPCELCGTYTTGTLANIPICEVCRDSTAARTIQRLTAENAALTAKLSTAIADVSRLEGELSAPDARVRG